ncbi:MAG: Na/Pi symporter [Bacteroidota bacterium]
MKNISIAILSIIICLNFSLFGQNNVGIYKPTSNVLNYSGDNQFQCIGEKINNPIRVQVLDEHSEPISGHTVFFNFGNVPSESKNYFLEKTKTLTDKNGIAETYCTVGNITGEYEIIVKISDKSQNNVLVYNIYAKKSNWLFILIISLLGGLGLFLYGMFILSEGLQKTAGDKMRSILKRLTINRFVGVGLGAFFTFLIQSSSTTSVMLVSFVQTKLLRFSQTIPVILGAAIGTTITVQIIAFKLTDYSLLLITVGFILILFKNNDKLKYLGQTIIGFGILFFGMFIMSEAMTPLRSYEPFINLLLHLENPLLGILAGMIFTALIQSSAAFIGIVIVIASQGFISLEASIPLVFGSNIGTSVTALLASIGTSREAKKVAIAHAFFKIIGVCVFVLWIPTFVRLIYYLSSVSIEIDSIDQMNHVVPRQIANVHTIFNILLAFLFLPFTNLIAKLINKILPVKIDSKTEFELKHLDKNLLNAPALALNAAKSEVIRMGNIVQDMLSDIILPFFTKEKALLKDIENNEKRIDFLRDEIKNYLVQISQKNIPKQQVDESFQLLYTVKEFEQIADLISSNLYIKAIIWIDSDNEFSDEGKKELSEFHLMIQKQLSRAIEVFRDMNLEKAKNMKIKHKKYRLIANEMEKHHYERLKNDFSKSISSSEIHLELIVMFREISSHITNIARIMIDWTIED